MEPTAQPDVPRERRHRQALQGEAATALMDQTLSAERRQLMLSAKIDGSDSAAPDARANSNIMTRMNAVDAVTKAMAAQKAREAWKNEVLARERKRAARRVEARKAIHKERGLCEVGYEVILDSVYDDRNLLKREHHRHNPAIMDRIEVWWERFAEYVRGSKKRNGVPRIPYFQM